jgi:hypothetical protein
MKIKSLLTVFFNRLTGCMFKPPRQKKQKQSRHRIVHFEILLPRIPIIELKLFK